MSSCNRVLERLSILMSELSYLVLALVVVEVNGNRILKKKKYYLVLYGPEGRVQGLTHARQELCHEAIPTTSSHPCPQGSLCSPTLSPEKK